MIGMSMGNDYQLNIFGGKGKPCELVPYVIEKVVVAGVHQDPFFAVDKIGVAIICGHAIPRKEIYVVKYLHGNPLSVFVEWLNGKIIYFKSEI